MITTQSQNIWGLPQREMYKQSRRAQAVLSFLSPMPSDSILDVGCGEGFVTHFLERAGLVVGIDTGKSSLLLAKHKSKQSNVEFICADSMALPLRTASFDKAVILEILEHLPDASQEKLCHEVERILKEKQSSIVVSVPYKEQIASTQCIHCGELTPLWGHLCSFDEQKLAKLFSDSYCVVARCHLINLEVILLSPIFKQFPFRIWILLNNALGKIKKGYWIMLKYQRKTKKTFGE